MVELVRVTIKPEIVNDEWFRREQHRKFIGKTFTGIQSDRKGDLIYINFEEPLPAGHNCGWKLFGLERDTRNIYGFHQESLHIGTYTLPDPPTDGEWE